LQNLVLVKEQPLEVGRLRSRLQEMEKVKVAWQRFWLGSSGSKKGTFFKNINFHLSSQNQVKP